MIKFYLTDLSIHYKYREFVSWTGLKFVYTVSNRSMYIRCNIKFSSLQIVSSCKRLLNRTGRCV